jgi:hypothetical protein
MYSDRNLSVIPRKLVHPFAEYTVFLINISLNTADNLVGTAQELTFICTKNIKYP